MRLLPRWLPVLVACAVLVPVTAVGAADPRIERSRAEVQRARQAEAAATARLDAAAAAYEEAWAHLERLDGEEERTRAGVVDAERRVSQADREVRDRLATLYKHPGLRFDIVGQAALGTDVGESLHQMELIDQLARHGIQSVAQADRAAGRVHAAERDYRLVTAGVREALRERRQQAASLSQALAEAEAAVAEADEALASAEAQVRAEREQRRRERALERARQAQLGARQGGSVAGAAPLPAIDGKACPVGAPNAFSDSWGAPRSGGRSHQGVDMFAAHGTPLYAVEAGTIRTSDNSLGGISLHLTGVSGASYYYAHLSERIVVTGDRVEAGQVVGAVGNTGNAISTPPHLHFEYHPGSGAPVNPTPLVTALCRS